MDINDLNRIERELFGGILICLILIIGNGIVALSGDLLKRYILGVFGLGLMLEGFWIILKTTIKYHLNESKYNYDRNNTRKT